MKEVRYMISDAAKKINVEPHVLRYWEEELGTEIPRNEMGHRYYREDDIRMMRGVKYLKEKGFQLKSIKILLPEVDKAMQLPQRRLLELRDRLELAVSQEELRLQREKELESYSGQEQKDTEGELGTELSQEAGAIHGNRADKDSNSRNSADDGRNGKSSADEGSNSKSGTDEGSNGKSSADEGSNNKSSADEGSNGKSGADEDSGAIGIEANQKPSNAPDNISNKSETDGQKSNISAESNPAGQSNDMSIQTEADKYSNNTRLTEKRLNRQADGMLLQKNELQKQEPEGTPVPVSDSAERMRQFRRIMNEIIMDVMHENNRELTGKITASVSKELEYHMRKQEMLQEEHFKQLDRTLREYQLGQKQAAVARECGSRRESKFFKKNGKVRI